MTNEEKLLAVARYLEGDMDAQESQAFETSLAGDPELQALLSSYQDVHLSLKMKLAPDAQDRQMEETLLKLNDLYFKEEAKVLKLTPYLRWISIAAVLVIGLLVWAPWSASLYEKYSISKEMSVAERGNSQKNNLEEAATLYNAGDYTAALKPLTTEYGLHPEHSLTAYYYGITLIQTGQENQGRAILLKLYEGSSVFKYDALYYIALSHVKQKHKEEAIQWLDKVPQGTANYEMAQALKEKLN